MYQLIIHHDTGVSKQDQQFIKEAWNLGHVYLELREGEDSIVYGILSGLDWSDLKKTVNTYQKYKIHGKDRLELAREYESQNPNDKILHSKTIEITEEQYLEGVILLDKYEQYLGQEIPSEIYGILGNNCAHFVNHIYRSIGLEGDYTRHYKTSELQQINTKLTHNYKILFDFNPGDKPVTVFGSSIEEVAKKYNLDVSKINKKEPIQGIPDMEAAMIQEMCDSMSFVIMPNKELLTEEEIVDQKATQERVEEGAFNNPNKTINELLNNPDKLAAYQRESIKLAMEGINEVDQVIPGFGNKILKSANDAQVEYGDFLTSITNPFYYNTKEKMTEAKEEESKTQPKSTKEQEAMDFASSILQYSMPSANDMKWAEDIAKATKSNLQNNLSSMENMNFLPPFGLPNTSNQGTANYLSNIFEAFNIQNPSMDFMGEHDKQSDLD